MTVIILRQHVSWSLGNLLFCSVGNEYAHQFLSSASVIITFTTRTFELQPDKYNEI